MAKKRWFWWGLSIFSICVLIFTFRPQGLLQELPVDETVESIVVVRDSIETVESVSLGTAELQPLLKCLEGKRMRWAGGRTGAIMRAENSRIYTLRFYGKVQNQSRTPLGGGMLTSDGYYFVDGVRFQISGGSEDVVAILESFFP